MKISIVIILVMFAASFTVLSQEMIWAKKVVSLSDVINYRSADELLGEPSIMPNFGFSECAWKVDATREKVQWIVLDFDTLVSAKSIHVYENINPGAITNITYFENDKEKTIYSNNSPKPISRSGRVLKVKIDDMTPQISKIKIYLNLQAYNTLKYQIDAVAISPDTSDYEVAINLTDFESEYFPVRLNEEINSEYMEVGPVISPSGRYLYFMRAGDPANYGNKSQDIYVAIKQDNGEFRDVINIGPPLNDEYSNYVISVLPDENQLIVGNIYMGEKGNETGFSISKKNGDEWDYPDSLRFKKFENHSREGTFCVGPSGKVFISAIHYEPCGGESDLYVSFLQEDSVWTEPVNMGKVLNTNGNEITPHIAPDNKTLYFSSNGFLGYGSYDIFVTHRLDDTWLNWSKPQNMGYRINSNSWDGYYTITASGGDSYYVSTVANSNTDIFTLKMQEENKTTLDPVVLVQGRVFNAKDSTAIGADIFYEELPSGNELGHAISNKKTGHYSIALPAGKKYSIRAQIDNMVAVHQFLDLTDLAAYKEIELNLEVVPIENQQTVRLNNIFFDFGEYILLEDSYPELNRVVDLIKNNPDIKIKIMGHTDDVGSVEDNRILSLNRANAVSEYLASQGIDKTRLEVYGYGKSKPIATNKTDEGRQLNRRVEFLIIKEQ